MNDDAEKTVSEFYNTVGWQEVNDVTEDARRWEDLRKCARRYVTLCRNRVANFLPASGDRILDMASGPIQYPEYLRYSNNFKERWCVDLSTQALHEAKKKLGDAGVYINKSFFDTKFQQNSFDAAISLHTIYHMDADRQEEAVRELIRVTKPDQPIVIVYGNPNSLVKRVMKIAKRLRLIAATENGLNADLYFYVHELSWWRRFEDEAHVKILPWRTFSAKFTQTMFPDNKFGKYLFDFLGYLENHLPMLMLPLSDYPMIILKKLPVIERHAR